MTLFTPRAARELRRAAAWIAADNKDAAEALLQGALRAAAMLVANPERARQRLDLAPKRYRFWSLRGYPYLLVIDVDHVPPVIARVLHQSRDLPSVLGDLDR